jgi:hypothetical protein
LKNKKEDKPMNNEIAAIIAELENEEVKEITIETANEIEITDAETEVVVEEEELMEDDVLIEDRPPVTVHTYKIGDAAMLTANAVNITGSAIPEHYKNKKIYIRAIRNGNYGFSINPTGKTSGFVVQPEHLVPYTEEMIIKKPFDSYIILTNADNINVKSKPTHNSNTLKTIQNNHLYTVIGEHNDWCHLKTGGWIPMTAVKKI